MTDGFEDFVAVHFGISLVRRLRHGLFFVVVICLEKHMCKIREGPCTRFQALFASARVPDVRRHAFRTSVPRVRVESEEKSAVNLNIVVAAWTQCSLVSHAHALNHDGTTFAEQRRALEEVTYRKNAATNYQAERRCTLVVNRPQITDSLEVFLSSRSAVACEILVAFDSKHTDGCIAKRIMDAPLEHALEHRSKTLIPASDMKENVDAQRCVDDAPEKEVETNEPSDFLTWWNQVVKSEGGDTWVDEFANAKSHTNVPLLPVETFLKSSVLKRQVIPRLNLKFMCRILKAYCSKKGEQEPTKIT